MFMFMSLSLSLSRHSHSLNGDILWPVTPGQSRLCRISGRCQPCQCHADNNNEK